MSAPEDQFVINRLRAKPVEYNIKIRHMVINGEWAMGVVVQDLAEDSVQRERVAADLRRAADLLEAEDKR